MLYQSINYIPTILPCAQANVIDASDRGLAFGDGLFTTAKISQYCIQYLAAHLIRLQDGCLKLGITGVDWQQLTTEMKTAAGQFESACLKVIITAGKGKRGYARDVILTPTIIVSVSQLPVHYPQWQTLGIRLGHSSLQLGINPLLAGLKHLNRLEQVLIRNELDTMPVDEVLVFDIQGHLVECNTANVFWLKAGKWFTPTLDTNGVNGIIRNRLLKLLGSVEQVKATSSDLEGVEAMLICNALLPVAPVSCYLDKKLNIHPVREVLKQLELDLSQSS